MGIEGAHEAQVQTQQDPADYLDKGPEKSPDKQLDEKVAKTLNKYESKVRNAKSHEEADKEVAKGMDELNTALKNNPKLAAAIKEGSDKKYSNVFSFVSESGKNGCYYSVVIKNEGGNLKANSVMIPWDVNTGSAP